MNDHAKTPNTLPDLMTSDDIATALRCDIQKAWQVIRENSDVLQAFKVGRQYRVELSRWEHFYELVRQGKIKI